MSAGAKCGFIPCENQCNRTGTNPGEYCALRSHWASSEFQCSIAYIVPVLVLDRPPILTPNNLAFGHKRSIHACSRFIYREATSPLGIDTSQETWLPVISNMSGDSALRRVPGVCTLMPQAGSTQAGEFLSPCYMLPAPRVSSLRWINPWLTTALKVSTRGWSKGCAFCLYSLWVCEGYIRLSAWRTYESTSLYPDAFFISLQIFFWSH